jgi:putative flippase GtrA
LKHEAFWFVLVGLGALATHWVVLIIAVSAAGLHPLVANVVGFLVAFTVSYFGHRELTFAAQDRPHRRTLFRFSAVAASMFLVNETLYWAMLSWTTFRYDIASLIVLAAVASLTFVLSKLWAFA